jgi:hypothetical protein
LVENADATEMFYIQLIGITITVADEEAGRCLDPEGNGVNPGGVNGSGSGEQDEQLISSRGRGNTLVE